MLPEFKIIRPSGIQEALKLLSESDCKIIAGGTDVIVELRKEEEIDYTLLDITSLSELRYIEDTGDKIKIGSLSTFSDVYESDIISVQAPLLKDAVENAGSLQIRNRGTIGGNICNASPAADSVPALAALDAVLTIRSVDSVREVAIEDFTVKPYKNVLEKGEILEYVTISKMSDKAGYKFYKLGRREALAISRMNLAVILETEGSAVTKAVISPGSVMPRPGRLYEAEKMLLGKEISEDLFLKAAEKVGELMIEASGVRWSTAYKEPVIKTMVRRALKASYERLQNG